MIRITPWAVLALLPFSQAQFDWLHARNQVEECCPCSSSGTYEKNLKIFTVTESTGIPHTVTINAPPYGVPSKETVTVEHTVTEPGHTITVTHIEEHTVTKEVTVGPGPSQQPNIKYAKTVTITSGPPSPSGKAPEGGKGDNAKTVEVESDTEKSPRKYVTVTVGGDGYDDNVPVKTLTVKNPDGSDLVKTVSERTVRYETRTVQEGDKYYTVIVKPASSTDTIQEAEKDYSIVVKSEPSTKTIALYNGEKTTQVIKLLHTVMVTPPPRTVTETAQQYQTITKTATDSNGEPDVEIITIDKDSGKSSCKKKNGLPCHGSGNNYEQISNPASGPGQKNKSIDSDNNGNKMYGVKNGGNAKEHYATAIKAAGAAATHTECPLMPISTSVQTVYNTVVMTVGPNGGKAPKPTQTATTPAAAQPTEGRKLRVRKSQAQLPGWW